MVSEVALRRGARLQRVGVEHVPLDEASAAMVQTVGADLAAWLGYASVAELQADSIGGRLQRLKAMRA
jgi:hypothetical protein